MSDLVAPVSLREFFKPILLDVITNHGFAVTEETEFYIVNLLAEFAFAERLFDQSGEGKKDHEPLALMFHRAQQQARADQIRTLRHLGDVSLYKAGFFAEALRCSVVGPEYHIQMGSTAYGRVATLAPNSFSGVYRELCEKFRLLVEALEEIAARGLAANGPTGTLKVYETWVRTGSNRLEKVLVDAGLVFPKSKLPN
jgi:hypothetical protein